MWAKCRPDAETQTQQRILTAPIRASPEPTLTIVGTMLNIPAWRSRGGRRTLPCGAAPPGSSGVQCLYLAVHHHAEADSVDLEKGSVAQSSSIFEIANVSVWTKTRAGLDWTNSIRCILTLEVAVNSSFRYEGIQKSRKRWMNQKSTSDRGSKSACSLSAPAASSWSLRVG